MSPTPATSRTPTLELRDIHLHRDGTDVIGKINSRVEQDQRWILRVGWAIGCLAGFGVGTIQRVGA